MEKLAVVLGVLAPVASGFFTLAYFRPRVARRIAVFCETPGIVVLLIAAGGLTSAVLCKMAVGRLAAGMFAGDFAITDGTIEAEAGAAEGGRYIIGRIADSVDPILGMYAWMLFGALALLALCRAGLSLARLMLEDMAEGEAAAPPAQKGGQKGRRQGLR